MFKKIIFPIFIPLLWMNVKAQDPLIKDSAIIENKKVKIIEVPSQKNATIKVTEIDTPDSVQKATIKAQNDTFPGMVEIIIKDANGNVKKIVRVDKELVGDFDLNNDDIVFRRKSPVHVPAKKPKKIENSWFSLDIGLNNYLYNGKSSLPGKYSNLEVAPLKSLNVSVGIFQQKIRLYKQLSMVYGVHYDNNDYRFTNDIDFKVNEAGDSITFAKRNLNGFERNKLTTRFLTIPIAFRIDFRPASSTARAPHLTFGVNGGYRLTSFFKTVRNDGGKQRGKSYDDFLLNNLRYGAFVKFGVGDLAIYGTYMLVPLFRENAGPELYPFAIGASLGGF